MSFLYLSIETPARKKMTPKIVKAQGLRLTKLFPNIPKTPNTRAIIPPIVNTNAKILIIIYFGCFYKNMNNINIQKNKDELKLIHRYKLLVVNRLF